MPFGKHRGTPIGELPQSYLEWLVTISYGRVFDEVCNVLSLSDVGPTDDIDDVQDAVTPRRQREETYENDTREVEYDDFGPVGFADYFDYRDS
jgi:uncharacterized protein (DUF3820 family)